MRTKIGILVLAALGMGAGAAGGGPSVRFAEVQLRTGVTLHYAEQGDAAGPAVILLHGYSDSWFSFSRVLPLLPREYQVFAPDQRGHGRSSRPDSGYAPRDLAGDVLAFMDAKGVARATLVGHSMGSFVAQQVALAAPDRVERLVLVSSAAAPRRVIPRAELEAAVMPLEDPVPRAFIREFQRSTVHVPVPSDFMERVIDESALLTAPVWKALLAGMLAAEPAPQLARAGIPTILIWGDRDAFFVREHQDELMEMAGADSLLTYAGVGHAPQWEAPKQVAEDLERFIGLPVRQSGGE